MRFRKAWSWYSAQAFPTSTMSLTTVLMAVSVMRAVARRLLPSTRQPMICARFCMLNLFIMTIMRTRVRIVKRKIDFTPKKIYFG